MSDFRNEVGAIPDLPILEFLLGMETTKDWHCKWATWFIYETEGQMSPRNSLARAMPLKEDTPGHLVLYKMKDMIRRGLVDGCGCGCRGDFVLADKGREQLRALNKTGAA